jgi:adenosylmethionine-8-amino-7-oxononanoate aminotransferase
VFDSQPDIIVTAKGISSGYIPLGAAIFSDAIHDVISAPDPDAWFTHGFTYSGHPVACAAGLKNIEIIEREKILRARARGRPLFRAGVGEAESAAAGRRRPR